MARRRTSADYEAKAANAKARENYYRTRTPRPRAGNTVTQKDDASYIYRSLFLKFTSTPGDNTSTEHLPFRVSVGQASIAKVPLNVAGLLPSNTTSVNVSLARPIRGSGMKPSAARWYNGTGTPTIRTTAYGTKWTQYYDNATGAAQSHYSIPLSRAAGDFGIADIQATFNNIFSDANRATLLGAKNGRAELDIEYASTFFSTTT